MQLASSSEGGCVGTKCREFRGADAKLVDATPSLGGTNDSPGLREDLKTSEPVQSGPVSLTDLARLAPEHTETATDVGQKADEVQGTDTGVSAVLPSSTVDPRVSSMVEAEAQVGTPEAGPGPEVTGEAATTAVTPPPAPSENGDAPTPVPKIPSHTGRASRIAAFDLIHTARGSLTNPMIAQGHPPTVTVIITETVRVSSSGKGARNDALPASMVNDAVVHESHRGNLTPSALPEQLTMSNIDGGKLLPKREEIQGIPGTMLGGKHLSLVRDHKIRSLSKERRHW